MLGYYTYERERKRPFGYFAAHRRTEEIEKNVVSHSDATAFANIVLPVPGGPCNKTPFQGRRIPRK